MRQHINNDLRERYRDLASTTVAKRSEYYYNERTLDRESWQEMAAEGLWRLPVPRNLGGSGGTWWDFISAFEGITTGGGDLGFTLSMVAHAGLIRSLMTFCDQEQLDAFLPPLLNGAVGATALTETSGGSDVARISTSAAQRPDGTFLLSGEKDHITHGPVADLVLTLARIPEVGDRDITLFMIDTDRPGVRRGEIEDMVGNRTSPTGPITFTDVALPASCVIGGVGRGLTSVYNTISLDRLLYGVGAAAYLEPVLDEVVEFAATREAFHAPIIDHQYVQGRLTDIKFGIETTRATAYSALEALLADDPQANLLCSIAKFQGSETLRSATEHAFRIFGHRGYMTGSISRRMMDGMGTLIAGGTSEMQRKNVFNQMMTIRRTKVVA